MNQIIKDYIKKVIGYSAFSKFYEIKMKKRKEFPDLKSVLLTNKMYEGIHRGDRCFILGNGPSLQEFDLSLLENEITFSVNQLARRDDFAKLRSNYHFWADERFFDLREDRPGDMELLDVMKNTGCYNSKITVFYKIAARKMISQYHLDDFMTIRYYDDCVFPRNMYLSHNVDFTQLVPRFSSVVHYAICMAVYMGFSEIYLLGCDCSGFVTIGETKLKNAEAFQYTYEISENEKKRMERVFKNISVRDELASYVFLFDTYEDLRYHCEKRNVHLYNATPNSLLDTLEKVDIFNILERKTK